MKKTTLLIISILTVQLLFSQPVLNSNLNFTIDDTFRNNMYHEVTNIEPGPGGTNMVWDFSQVTGSTFIEGVSAICVDPSTTPFADSAAVASANICIRNVDNPDYSPYQYFEGNNTSRNLLAMGWYESGNTSFTTYTDIMTTIEFPFTYGDSFDDTWELLGYHIDMGYYFMRDSAIVTVEADAYGTITTPTGVFENALRLKSTTIDYFWYRYEQGGAWVPSGPFTTIEYIWCAPNIKVPVMNIEEMVGYPGYMVTYLVEYNFQMGIEDMLDYNLEISPNPTTDRVTIKTDEMFNSVSIYSLNGQQLDVTYSQTGQSHQQTIDLSKYPKGVYLIEVGFEDGNVVKEKIIKQ